jgi:hypothetical protein
MYGSADNAGSAAVPCLIAMILLRFCNIFPVWSVRDAEVTLVLTT